MDCSALFTKVPTDMGMCCALNMETALLQSQYSDLVQEMQAADKES